LGFKGLTVTDDLEMGAITATRDLSEAAVMAIEAGIDMVLIAGSPERATAAWEAMVNAAREGRITKTHISRSFDHLARIKSMLSRHMSIAIRRSAAARTHRRNKSHIAALF
jgi:beta-N-acetylhexosaminidase